MNKLMNLTEQEKKLLDILQTDFPVMERPFKEIGKVIGLSENEIIEKIKILMKKNIIRQIGAIYNTDKMNFNSSLISFKISDDKIDAIAEYINKHPGVSHNYKRDDEYNLWFTFAVPKKYSIEHQITKINEKFNIKDILILPKIKTFKRKVVFKLSERSNISTQINENISEYNTKILKSNINELIMKELQDNITITPTPFKDIAEKYSIQVDDLLNYIYHLIKNNIMIRFSAIIKNQNIGYNKNAMAVWNIPENKINSFGSQASNIDLISHCYLRKTSQTWPYNMYTMIHGKTEKDNNIIINKLLNDFKIKNYKIIYSLYEYKKQRINYFSNEYKNWN